MRASITRRLPTLFVFLSAALSGFAQSRADISVVGGAGVAGGEEQNTSGLAGIGASAGFPYSGRHRFQLDYFLANAQGRNHFLTGSYILQARTGRSRPFFQAGAGIVHRRNEIDTSLAIVLGAGATIDLGESLFIRPLVRVYAYVGPTLALVPSVAIGYRF